MKKLSPNAGKILGISVTNSSKETILEEIQKYLDLPREKSKKSLKIYTPNTEQLVRAQSDDHFAQVLNRADVALPDSIGVVWAGRMVTQNGPKTVIPGVEFMESLVALAADRHVPIGLIGGRPGIAVRALECLQNKYPELDGWGLDPESSSLKKIVEKTHSTNTQIVFVGLGAPKQEYFIENLVSALSFRPRSRNPGQKTSIPGQARDDKRVVLMSVGGSFDIIAGVLPRAPVFMRSMGLEWIWRLLLQPWRFVRQLSLLKFVWLVLQDRLSRGARQLQG